MKEEAEEAEVKQYYVVDYGGREARGCYQYRATDRMDSPRALSLASGGMQSRVDGSRK